LANPEVVVVGSGPNGLAAAIVMAQAGLSVCVLEAEQTLGGGARTLELTLPGYRHDLCSAAHPLGIASPFFRTLPLDQHGLEWVHSPYPVVHPLDDGTAGVLAPSVEGTAALLGEDGKAYETMMGTLVEHWEDVLSDALTPISVPHHPLLLARLGWFAVRSTKSLVRSRFRTEQARALLAGIAAHAGIPLTRPFSAAFALMLGLAGNAKGWPIARGGSQSISDALAGYLRSLGGEIVTGVRVKDWGELPSSARTVLLDLTPRQVLALLYDRLPEPYREAMQRYRYGPGSFKIDWALSGAIPWRAEACRKAATVHVGGSLAEIIEAEAGPIEGRAVERPFVLVVQPTLFDPSRAPEGRHIAWAWCHVPLNSNLDMTDKIEAQIERFAPGFRDLILAKRAFKASELSSHNSNLVEGDISGGTVDVAQLVARPIAAPNPYATPLPGVYLCSASTPPGPGVHGMCGYNAAQAALRALQ
jgi:phytoene dehydrogenase-like protein